MKKTIIISTLLAAGAMGAFAQGTVQFTDALTGSKIHIFQPQLATPTVEIQGNMSTDSPTGSTVYTGGFVGGSATGTGLGNGFNISVELFAAPGTTATSFSQLSPVTQYLSSTSTKAAGAGSFSGFTPSGDPGIPNDPSSLGVATIAIAAWYNGGSASAINPNNPGIPYSTAVTDKYPVGNSALFVLSGLGYGTATAAAPVGQTSFSLVTQAVPEPSTIALGLIGASSFLLRRRNNK